MTALAALTLANGETTPANKTFSAVNVDATGIASWEERSSGTAIGFPILTFSVKAPKNPKGPRNYRLVAKIVVPVLEAVAVGATPVLAFPLIANVEMVFNERSTEAQRKDTSAFMKNFLSSATFIAAVASYERTY